MFEKLEELAKNNKKISDFHIRAGSTLESSSTIIDSEISSTGEPPYSSGIVTPCRP